MFNHLLHPFALYRSTPRPVHLRMYALDAGAISGITPLLRQRLLDAAKVVQSFGFGPPFYASNAPATALPFDAAIALFERTDGRALAYLHASEGAHTKMKVTFSMSTTFADGTLMSTSNVEVIMRTPSRRFTDGLAIPGCADLSRLWAVHQHRVLVHERRSAVLPMTRGDDPPGYQRDEAITMGEHWVASGYYRPFPDGRLRFTPLGATLAAWRGLFPWKHLKQRRHARRTTAVLCEMELHQ